MGKHGALFSLTPSILVQQCLAQLKLHYQIDWRHLSGLKFIQYVCLGVFPRFGSSGIFCFNSWYESVLRFNFVPKLLDKGFSHFCDIYSLTGLIYFSCLPFKCIDLLRAETVSNYVPASFWNCHDPSDYALSQC